METEAPPPLDVALLTPIVGRILGAAGATVAEWRVESLGYRVINGITGGCGGWRARHARTDARPGGRRC